LVLHFLYSFFAITVT